MSLSGILAMMFALQFPSTRRWRDAQTAAEGRISEREALIKAKIQELEDAVLGMRRHRLQLDLVTRAGRRLRTNETLAASFGKSIADMGHRIVGHD